MMRLIIVLTIALLQLGCVTPDTRLPGKINLAMNATQPASNIVSDDEADRMIVVTITNEFHRQLTGGKPIMQPNATPPRNYQKFLSELKQQYQIKTIADWPLDSLGVRCFIFQVAAPSQRNQAIELLAQDSRIETVQPLQQFSTAGESYNDPYLKLQPHYRELGIDKSHRWATGKGITIAVIDTGADTTHEDLKKQISKQRNFVDKDEQSFLADKHGTAISGVIAAATDNATGMSGIAPGAQIYPMKACWQLNRQTDKARCSSFTLAKAINFAIINQVDIINLSLTGPDDPLLERLIKKAQEKHITIVAAIGPDPAQNFPANMQGVFAVQTSENKISEQQLPLSLSAPGNQILSTAPQNQYEFFNGSSFSTAQASGLIALIKERKPHISDAEIIANLKVSSPVFRANDKTNISINPCQVLAHILDAHCE